MLYKKVRRLTVLYGSSDELKTNVSQNDTCLTFRGGENVAVQDRIRLLFNRDTSHHKSYRNSTRITWLSPHSVDKFNGLGDTILLQPVLSPGFNVYTRDQIVVDYIQSKFNGFGPPVRTPKYTVFHSLEFFANGTSLNELLFGLGKDYDLNFDWKFDDRDDDVQYNIEITNDQIQIDEYRNLSSDETLTILKEPDISKLEVGTFFLDMQDEDDVNLSGFRCLWREDGTGEIDKCIKTSLFYKPAFVNWSTDQRQEHTTVVPITLETPIGMHPKVQVDLRNVTTPKLDPEDDNRQCDFYFFAQLPLEIFVDKFQSHPVFVFGERDLELPEYKLRDKGWGSEVLYTLQAGQLNEITLHSRYLAPVYKPEPLYGITTFFPQVFMACDSDTESVVSNPFYSKSLGFESFFTDNTVFYPLNVTRLEVPIPRAEADSYKVIQLSTLFVVVSSLVYLLSRIFGPLTKPRDISEKKIQ